MLWGIKLFARGVSLNFLVYDGTYQHPNTRITPECLIWFYTRAQIFAVSHEMTDVQ